MNLSKRLLIPALFLSSLAWADIVESGPGASVPGLLPVEALDESTLPAERKLGPVKDEATTKAFQNLLSRLTSRDYHEREAATRELSKKLSTGNKEERVAWLSLALGAMENEATPPEATQIRIPRAIAESGTSLAAVDWTKAYCRWVKEKAERLAPEAAMLDRLLKAVDDPRKIKIDVRFAAALVKVHRAKVLVERAREEVDELKAKTPKALQDQSQPLQQAKKDFNLALDELAKVNEEGTTLKHAETFRESVTALLTKAGFEVEPTFVGTATSALTFVVKKGDAKSLVQVTPVVAEGNWRDAVDQHALSVQVFPIPAKEAEVSIEDFLDPVLASRYDFGKIPKLKLPPVGIGAIVRAKSGKAKADGVPATRQVSGPELVGRNPVVTEVGDLTLPQNFLTELQPQLYWDQPFTGSDQAKANQLRARLVREFSKKRAEMARACGKLEAVPPKPLTPVPVEEKLVDRIPFDSEDDDESKAGGDHDELKKKKK